MSTSAPVSRGHRRSGSEVEEVKQPVQEQQNPSAAKTYLKNLGTSVAGIALTRITGMQNYIRTPEKVKDGIDWLHTKVKNIRILPGAAAQVVAQTAEQPVVPNGEPMPAPQQPVATTAAPAPTQATTASQQPVAPTAPTPNTTTESTIGLWDKTKEALSNAKTGAFNLGNSVVEHFSVNRGWYGRAIGFAATYHALNYAVDRFASHRIKNEHLRRAVSFGVTTAAVWAISVHLLKHEISAYDVVDTGMQVLLTTKVLEFGVPYIKAGYGRLPNLPAWVPFTRKAEVLKEKTA